MPLPRLACALTFDDGWQDNFEYAFPALEQHAVPATIFLVSTLTGTSHEFWPNRLGRLLMGSSPLLCLPPSLEQVLKPVLSSARSKNTWHRDDLDRAVELAKRIDEYEIHSILDELESARPHVAPSRRAVLNQEEVREMAASGLVRFGSHTRTHYRFRGEIAEEVLEREIGLSRVEVIRDAGGPAEVFCYPNGDVTEAAVDRVRQHYLAAVTTRAGWHVADADPHLMQRIGVHEDVSDTPASFLARISGWL